MAGGLLLAHGSSVNGVCQSRSYLRRPANSLIATIAMGRMCDSTSKQLFHCRCFSIGDPAKVSPQLFTEPSQVPTRTAFAFVGLAEFLITLPCAS